MRLSASLLALALGASAVVSAQFPLGGVGGSGAGTRLSPASDMTLSSVQGGEHVVLQHPAYPQHAMRIKTTTGWCDPDVRSYSGYLDTGDGRELFFYFFESRSSPKDDPVLMWINGGPGCSSSLGLFMELGPCSISDPTHINGTKVNPYSWNERANVFFLEEPLGVGFSYGAHGQVVGTTEEAAKDVAAFVGIFFETFKEFKGRELFLSGESYGGRYLPVFGSAILDANAGLEKKGMTPINLKKILIGNGMTDTYSMMEGYYTYQCTNIPGQERPIANIGQCVAMAKALPYCKEQLERECLSRHDPMGCAGALSFCQNTIGAQFWSLGLNPYDISKPCTREELSDGLCYGKITGAIAHYLDLPEVRGFLGVDKSIGNFSSCNSKVGMAFALSGDVTDFTWLYVAGLLERGIDVISYVGEYDWICNYHGNAQWTDKLKWTGGAAFRAEEMREWTVDGKVAGTVKSSGGLTFATIHKAGHMVPYDKPKEALAMLQRYMAGEAL